LAALCGFGTSPGNFEKFRALGSPFHRRESPCQFLQRILLDQPVSLFTWRGYRPAKVQQFPVRHFAATRDREATRQAVARAEAYLRAHVHGRVRVAQLCRVVGLSERGLRNAFYRVHGVSPTRWIKRERLQGVHDALIDESMAATVTSVAADFGFYELGRFAAVYRDAFGEAPSDTLRASGRNTSRTNQTKRARRCLTEYAR
jgi:transcriptional regulator GlxA family with amidase domain